MGAQPARMNYVDMMRDAGLGDVLIPKKEFVKEHERLVDLLNQSDIPALRKEAKAQKAELEKEGGSGKSNYIARLMAEAKYKHAIPADKEKPYRPARGKNKDPNPTQGAYRKPVMDPERDDTNMSRADKFDYNKLGNASQVRNYTNPDGEKNPYGASPFITHHFGLAKSASKPKETAEQTAARRKFSGREARVPRAEAKKAERKSTSSFASRNEMKYRPSLLLENKIRELVRPTKSFIRKGESPVRTPAEQREVDRQLKNIVEELDANDYDPRQMGIKGFDPDKYRD